LVGSEYKLCNMFGGFSGIVASEGWF